MKKTENGTWISWNENIQHTYDNLYQITTEEELTKIIASSKKVRIFGNKQSSADISAGLATLIDIKAYNKILHYNDATRQITVQSGIKLVDLIEAVEAKGWCIPCLPDINTVTLGGALATGTHGTSGKLLASYVYQFRVVLADGSIKEITAGEELMDAFRVSIGVLGVISTITFTCNPIYTLHIKEGPQKDALWIQNLEQKLKNYDFLRILWLPHTGKGYVITGKKIPSDTIISEKTGPSYLKHRRTVSKILYKYTHLFPWFTSIANKILGFIFFNSNKEYKGSLYQATVTKSRGATLELAEWSVPLSVFPKVFQELKKEINQWNNSSFIHIPMDVRFVKKDNSWLSYAYKEDTVTMGCVSRNASTADSYEAFKTIETIFIKYGGRPHWAKRFKAKDAQLGKIYPKWKDFKKLRKELDPTNKFLNAYLKTIFNEK
ncbi:D-arabinono-1,4-lactone oxidase [Flavicella sediminum]|uniref:D-arabinono-1,4-lactone oxidase n=1 Tax=Flavicella sediminum TaxID=2585141 RepID=UPI001120BA3E|nr:D-arabinono-1,4-lactone oxidase [Flavicella sediminum]